MNDNYYINSICETGVKTTYEFKGIESYKYIFYNESKDISPNHINVFKNSNEQKISPIFIKNTNNILKNEVCKKLDFEEIYQKYKLASEKKMVKCNCKKTQCQKSYCPCYLNNEKCVDCGCKDCQNSFTNLHSNKRRRLSISNKGFFCNCTKSNCQKKYCECYKANRSCNELCRCICCKNKAKGVRVKKLRRERLKIESFSIHINKSKIKIKTYTI